MRDAQTLRRRGSYTKVRPTCTVAQIITLKTRPNSLRLNVGLHAVHIHDMYSPCEIACGGHVNSRLISRFIALRTTSSLPTYCDKEDCTPKRRQAKLNVNRPLLLFLLGSYFVYFMEGCWLGRTMGEEKEDGSSETQSCAAPTHRRK